MGNLADRIARGAGGPGSLTFPLTGESGEWKRMYDEAISVAATLQSRGVAPRSRVCVIGPTTKALVTAMEAIWLAGATMVALPLPMRVGSLAEFVAQTRSRVRSADPVLVVADPMLAGFLEPEPGDPPVLLLSDLSGDPGTAGRRGAFEEPSVDDHDLAILQFTSGSTSDPKGVMLPHRAVCANLSGMAAAAHLDPSSDVLVSWLPLYHDMGLIGLLLEAMTTGADLVLAAPQEFLAAPARWMEWMSAFGGTISAGPNFSYALATRALRRASSGLDLSRWRIALNGAESIDPDAVEAFCGAAAPFGFDPGSIFPAFGMAEATLGVTFPEPGAGLRIDTVKRDALETDRQAVPVDGGPGSRRLVRLGRAIPGLEIRIVDPEATIAEQAALAERQVGELQVRGASVSPGYFRRPEDTAAAFNGEWLRSGDLAYLVDGELVICGRIKDLIIVGGRNVYPEDVERAAAGVEGVRAGNVIAFGVAGRKGREALVVVAETRTSDQVTLRGAVTEAVRDSIGLSPEEVVLVEPGTLPKTTSGKLQRRACRDRYRNGALATP